MSELLGPEGPNLASLLLKGIGYLALIGLLVFFYRLYQTRMLYRRVQKEHGIVSISSYAGEPGLS